jgi:N-methylhydantoinase A/oxoprolinase/acetone carboxylase beta subunit
VTAPNTIRLGLDIGGTFTDVALEAGGRRVTAKMLTTSGAPDANSFDGKHRCEGQKGHTKLVVGCGSSASVAPPYRHFRSTPGKPTSRYDRRSSSV